MSLDSLTYSCLHYNSRPSDMFAGANLDLISNGDASSAKIHMSNFGFCKGIWKNIM